ncbi:Gx transporter family protein [Candidatus Oleimmundimicrobium sp.]|uniref:Gx transporter family protein n=1 Tax=Candidatus Oleimmundimicrobium sp. TaxID=3060597 RepID=UPI0027213B50|nr:Gx transporter family protein [Candidatus Oleimmundimicrobium sp.]MDO8886136.1 Gx transporter family protein [Candidatus Oleimmundimicrobium sp.]
MADSSYNVKKMIILALFLAIGIALYVIEFLYLPMFSVPGVKLGLANIVTLILVVFFSWKDCIFNAIARTLIGSIITGVFLTPAFIFSLGGALVSTVVMLITYKMFYGKFSLVGVSVAGATSHNITQLILAVTLFIKHWGVILQVPVLILAAVITGTLNGIIANLFVKKAVSIPEFSKTRVATINLRGTDGNI